jgi:hypothetical protein
MLKRALKILKSANQGETIGYIFLLKRLAHVCYLGRKFADAEKFFQVVIDLVPKVTSNPLNAFAAQKNMLLLYTYTDLDKAKALSERMALDAKDMLPLFLKELKFMTANIHFLRGDYMLAKLKYRELLTMDLKPQMNS